MGTRTQKIGIDIFSGAGGLSLGAIAAGIRVVCAIEKDKFAAETFRANHEDVLVLEKDIKEISPKSTCKQTPFIVFGGPPCQGFSLSNTKTRNEKNQNNYLFREFVRFVSELKPEWFLFENVEGIVRYRNGNTVKEIEKCFQSLGYTTNHQVLHASDYGVPQNRSRFIMVGNKNGIKFQFPPKQKKIVTVREAIGDLPNLENGEMSERKKYLGTPSKYAKDRRQGCKFATQNFVSKNKNYVLERYKYIKPGENWEAIPDSLMKNYANKMNCHSGIYRRLDPDKPSVVISNYRKNMLIHPFEDRGLSVREAARLQSFPDTFEFKGSINHIQQQIGNAVPPLLAEAIFKSILKHNGQKIK